jgi:hypothetical protein
VLVARAAFDRILDETCGLAVRPRLRLGMPKLLSRAGATSRRHYLNPAEATGAGGERRLYVITTHAPFALKVQGKVSNGVAALAAHHLKIGRGNSCPSQR